jgi:hypothetical protein
VHTEYFNAQTAHVKYGTPNKTDLNKLPIDEVVGRINEMGDCQEVDAGNEKKYLETLDFYSEVQKDRVLDFMTRHKLWPQFRAEDARGLR